MAYFLLHIGRRFYRAVLFACFCGLFLVACSESSEEPPFDGEIAERPMMLFTDTTLLDFYEKERLSWKVKTA